MLIVLLVCWPLVLGEHSEFGTTEVEPGITEFTPVPQILETNPNKTKISFSIRSCVPFVKELAYVRIPVLHSDFEYFEENILIDSENPLEKCPFGGTPSTNVTYLASNDDLARNDISRASLLRSVTTLLDTGYLSVGYDKKNLTYYSPHEYCLHSISNGNYAFRICAIEESRAIIKKCCPLQMVYDDQVGCVLSPQNLTWSPEFMDVDTNKLISFDKANGVFTSNRPSACEENENELHIRKDSCDLAVFPSTQYGFMYLTGDRIWKYDNDLMCFDTTFEGVEFGYVCKLKKADEKKSSEKPLAYVYMVCMFIAALFHLMTSVVYLITWKGQNVNDKALCSCTISLFCSSMLAGTIHVYDVLQISSTAFCVSLGIAAHYFQLASFTWLLIVNFDVFQKFRKLRTGKKGLKTLLKYSALGWGFPVTVVIISVTLNFTFTCATSMVPIPGYGTRNCFMSRYSQGYYLYYILAALIAPSVCLSVATLVNLYKSKKAGSNLQSSKKQSEAQNALMYIRLSVMMGITWIFEVISWIFIADSNPHVIWVLLDVYNILSAILIFIFFVCRKRTLDLLKKTNPHIMQIIDSVVTSTTTLSTDSK